MLWRAVQGVSTGADGRLRQSRGRRNSPQMGDMHCPCSPESHQVGSQRGFKWESTFRSSSCNITIYNQVRWPSRYFRIQIQSKDRHLDAVIGTQHTMVIFPVARYANQNPHCLVKLPTSPELDSIDIDRAGPVQLAGSLHTDKYTSRCSPHLLQLSVIHCNWRTGINH